MERDNNMSYKAIKIASRYCSVGALTLLLFCIAMFLTFPATAGFYDKPAKIRTTPEEWLPLALEGDTRSQLNLGWAYENGKGVEQNFTEAAKWYAKAAEGGLRRGVSLYAKALEEGKGVEVDLEAATKLYSSIDDLVSLTRVRERQRKEAFSVLQINNEVLKKNSETVLLDRTLVKEVQVSLNKMGYKISEIDGEWGTGTLSAAHWFAKDFNYVIPFHITNDVLLTILHSLQDQLGRKSVSLINQPAVSNAFNSLDTQMVIKVQSALVKLGYSIGRVDGVLGSKSLEALGQFSRDYNLELPRPITNQVLSAALYSLNEKISNKTTLADNRASERKYSSGPYDDGESHIESEPLKKLTKNYIVALIAVFLMILVVLKVRKKIAKVDLKTFAKSIALPESTSEIDSTYLGEPIEALELPSSVKKLSDASSSFVASKSTKKRVPFEEKITRYFWLYVGLSVVVALLFVNPMAALGTLAFFMAGWGGLFGDFFYKIGIVQSKGIGGFVSVVIGLIIAGSLAFIR